MKTITKRRPLTAQQIFTKVATHLLKQNAKSQSPIPDVEGDLPCRYHGDYGRSCAVGCLIPKAIDTSDIEGMGPESAFSRFPEIFEESGLMEKHLALLGRLQEVHDKCSPPQWPRALLEVGKTFKLTACPLLRDACAATHLTPVETA